MWQDPFPRNFAGRHNTSMKPTFLFPTLAEIPVSLRGIKLLPQKVLRTSRGIRLLCIGPGQSVATALEKNAALLQGSCLVLIGYGGALRPSLQCGDIVLCNTFCTDRQPPLAASKQWHCLEKKLRLAGLSLLVGSSYTVREIVSDQHTKENLHHRGACVAEMENYWASLQARKLKIPLVGLRIILDTFGDRLPNLADTITAQGTISLRGIILHLGRHPTHLWQMGRLWSMTRKIQPVLDRCVRALSTE